MSSPRDKTLLGRAVVVTDLIRAIEAAVKWCDPACEVSPGVYAGENLAELLAEALHLASERCAGVERLLRHRPGCWEADHIRALACR